MAIIPQVSLFEYSEIEVLGDLERLKLALEGIDDEAFVKMLEEKRRNGRDDYPVRVMWNLVIAMKVFEHPTVESFRRELARNSQLRKMCGLYDEGFRKHLVPPSRVFSGFLGLLSGELTQMEKIFDNQVTELYTLLPGFGRMLAGDGKYLDSVAPRKSEQDQTATDRRTENDAEWSVKEYHYIDANGKTQVKKEYHFGFKAHIICDINSELPITFSVTKANADERAEMIKLLECSILSNEERRRIAEYLMLDRGYDSTELITSVKSAGILPVVDIRNCWKNGEITKHSTKTPISSTITRAMCFLSMMIVLCIR